MSRFAFSLDKSTIPKLIMNSFPDNAEYIGQLVTRLREYGATKMDITTNEDSCIIRSDTSLGEEEEKLIEKVKTSPKAIPYSLGFKYFKDLKVSGVGGSTTLHLYNEENEIKTDETRQEKKEETKIVLSQRQKRVDERAYCREKFEYSDLEVMINGEKVNREDDTGVQFKEGSISGRVIISDKKRGQHFYFGGKKITEKEISIPHVLFVYHEHPFSPVFSHNDLSDYDEKVILEERNKVVNEVIQEFVPERKISYENLLDIIRYDFGNEHKILSEETLSVVKEYPLFEDQSTSFNEINSMEKIYVNRDGFKELVGDKLQEEHIILEEKDAELYELLGGEVISPEEVPLFRTFSKLRELPDYSARLVPYEAEKFLESLNIGERLNPGKLNGEVKELSDFLSDYGIYIDSAKSEIPIQQENGKYVVGEKNRAIRYFLTKDVSSSVPVAYQILSMHFENQENQMIGLQRKEPEELIRYIMKQYLQT